MVLLLMKCLKKLFKIFNALRSFLFILLFGVQSACNFIQTVTDIFIAVNYSMVYKG